MTRILTILGAVMLIMQVLGAFRYVANEWKLWRRGHGPMMCVLFVCCVFTGTAQANHNPGGSTVNQESICANSVIIFCDNFEDRATEQTDIAVHTYKNNGYAVSLTNATAPRITSTAAGVYAGTKALQLTYPAGMNTGGGFLDSSWSNLNVTSSTTLYMRWYQKFSSGFRFSYIATKNMEWITSNGQPEIFSFNFSQWNATDNGFYAPKRTKQFFYYSTHGSPDAWTPTANAGQGDFQMADDTWYCMEARYTMNTTTTSTDGYLQVWVNDVKYYEHPNVNLNKQTGAQGPITGTLISGYWNCTGLATTGLCDDPAKDDHPLQYRWIDNLVVSTARIGCIGNYGGGAASSNMYIMILKSLDGIGQWIGLGLSAGGLLMRQSVRAWMWRGALASMAALLCLGVGVKTRILLSSAYVRHHTITVAEKYLEHVTTKKG